VIQGEELIVLESMKMEIPVEASIAGAVASLFVAPGDTVKRGDVLLVLEERPTPS
jgi:acetyl-CoA carboxylase biotin carboxyl carrier protein